VEAILREQQDVEDDLKRKVAFLESELERREALESDFVPLICRSQTDGVALAPGDKQRLQEAEEQIFGLRRRLSELGRETEQQSKASLQLEHHLRDRADEMEAKWIQAEALVARLTADLQDEQDRLEEANRRFSQLWRRSEEQRQELAEARQTIKMKEQTLERELQQRSALLMRRRTTARRNSSTFASLAQELTREPNQLEQENEELMDEVTKLRDMLSRAEMQIMEASEGTAAPSKVSAFRPGEARSRCSTSGDLADLAAPRTREAARSMDSGRADLAAPRTREAARSMDSGATAEVELLRAELARTRAEVERAEARLRQQRSSFSQRSGGVSPSSAMAPQVSRSSSQSMQQQPLRCRIATDEPDSDTEFFGKPAQAEEEKVVEKAEPGWWERVASATVGIVCCREHRPLHQQSSWVGLSYEDSEPSTARSTGRTRKVSFDPPPTPPSYNY